MTEQLTSSRAAAPGQVHARAAASRVVLLVHNSADLYGASRSLLRLVQRLPGAGIRPTVILPETGPLHAELQRHGVRVFVQPKLSVITRDKYRSLVSLLRFIAGIPISAWEVNRVARRVNADLIHTNTGVIVSPALAAWVRGVPHVWHIRDSFQEFGRIWSVYEHYIRWLSSRVICVSSAIARQFRSDNSVTVINNGFPLEEFRVDKSLLRRDFRKNHGLLDSDVVIGVVGRIKFVRKGQEFLVQAVKRLTDQGVKCRLVIVGSTASGNEEHETRLKILIERLGLRGVVFTGDLADPRPAYAGIDILALPSAQPEPFGGVVIEGMAMGLPIVATRLGGSVDQVEHEVTGFLVPPADVGALADAIGQLVADRERRERMGAAGFQRMSTLFHIDVMLRKILAEYDACLALKAKVATA